MPLNYAVKKSPSGMSYVRTISSGTVTGDEAQHLMVTNGPLRIVLSFIIRMNRSIGATRFVATEEEGLKWLARAPRPAVPMSRSKRPPTGQTGR